MILSEQIGTMYQYFYMKYSGNTSYLFVPDEQHKKTINKFIEYLYKTFGKHSINSITLYNFFCVQFYHYSQPGAIKSKRYLQLGHIIGNKAIERFDNTNYYNLNDALIWASKEYYIFNEIDEILNYSGAISFRQLEDIERKRFLNTEHGLSNCLLLAIRYYDKSENCKTCKFSVECRKLI